MAPPSAHVSRPAAAPVVVVDAGLMVDEGAPVVVGGLRVTGGLVDAVPVDGDPVDGALDGALVDEVPAEGALAVVVIVMLSLSRPAVTSKLEFATDTVETHMSNSVNSLLVKVL